MFLVFDRIYFGATLDKHDISFIYSIVYELKENFEKEKLKPADLPLANSKREKIN